MKEFKMNILDSDKRLVAGWASVEVVDADGQYVPIDELVRAMIDYVDRGGLIMYGHSNKPVGRVIYWDVREHPETGKPGVYIIAKINRGYKLDDMVWESIKKGVLKGFSIAGMGSVEKQLMKSDDGEREVDVLKDIELTEISIVERPANPFAMIEEFNVFAKGKGNTEIEFDKVNNVIIFKNKEDAEKFANTYGGEVVDMGDGKYLVKPLKYDQESLEGLDMEIGKAEGMVNTGMGESYENPRYGDKAYNQLPHVRDLGELIATFDDKEKAEEYARECGCEAVPTRSGRWAVIKRSGNVEVEKAIKNKQDLIRILRGVLEDAKVVRGYVEENSDSNALKGRAEDIVKTIEALIDELEEGVIEVEVEKADASTKSEIIDRIKSILEKYAEDSEAKREIPKLAEWIWENYIDVEKPKPVGEFAQEIADRLGIKAYEAKEAWDKIHKILKPIREEEKEEEEEVKKSIPVVVEFMKPNDVRPPKEWLERKVKELMDEQGLDKESATRFAAWIYWHWMKPTKPKDKEEKDKPDTKEARQRKRKWLKKDIDILAVKEMDIKQLIMEGIEEEANAIKIYIALRNKARELGFDEIADWIEEIIEEEEEHLADFKNMWRYIDPEGYTEAEVESMGEYVDYTDELIMKSIKIKKKLKEIKKKGKTDCMKRYKDPNQPNRFKKMTCPDEPNKKTRFCGCVRAKMNCDGMSIEQAKKVCEYIYWYVKKGEIKDKIKELRKGLWKEVI